MFPLLHGGWDGDDTSSGAEGWREQVLAGWDLEMQGLEMEGDVVVGGGGLMNLLFLRSSPAAAASSTLVLVPTMDNDTQRSLHVNKVSSPSWRMGKESGGGVWVRRGC